MDEGDLAGLEDSSSTLRLEIKLKTVRKTQIMLQQTP